MAASFLFAWAVEVGQAAGIKWPDSELNFLALPKPGEHHLRVLTPTLLELTRTDLKPPDPAPLPHWNFVDSSSNARIPPPDVFQVRVNHKPMTVTAVGFKRRPVYAPLKQRDLRVQSHLYLQLADPIPEGAMVDVESRDGNILPNNVVLSAASHPLRWSPAVHVNHLGYLPGHSKKAMVGYYLGNLGEMPLPTKDQFQLVCADSGETFYTGTLAPRPDLGYTFSCYQQVWEADFTEFTRPGEYRLMIPGLGVSFPFHIDDGVAAGFARTYALGLYHQRCGAANAEPFTRHVHGPCHTAHAEIPTHRHKTTQRFLRDMTGEFARNERHSAPQLKDIDASLYPFVNSGSVDVSGGHHDAGDYSKYTINSALLVHHLVFAADAFPGVGALDNLGVPESGDGVGDLLQLAHWEADFLGKMQDADGGFYFLVYPRDRKYEDNVLPDQGDTQVVFPKNTAVTAAAVAALAQTASSPRFRREHPVAAERYLKQALHGWEFLTRAIERHGKDGSYQKITHYGDTFMHDDELAWAACELFLATGDSRFQDKLVEWFNPADPKTRRWGWWRLFEAYGCAIRSFAFAAQTGRLPADKLDAIFLRACQSEIRANGADQLRYSRDSAYGLSFPTASKRHKSAGWFFSADQAYDLAVASLLDYPEFNDPRPAMLDALIRNLNYEAGCNPPNTVYVTGLGWKRQREVVHHYAQNDRRALPPTGISIGNIQAGFQYLDHYKKEHSALAFPSDDDPIAPYPFYDRWADSFNVSTEGGAITAARSLGTAAFLMAKTPLATQPWKPASAIITGLPERAVLGDTLTARLEVDGLAPRPARIVWEARGVDPVLNHSFAFTPPGVGPVWVEVEAQWPDGRRVFASTQVNITLGNRATTAPE